ncbi:MAG: glycosyltransferase family 4 protein [Pseudomonadota bacterium]
MRDYSFPDMTERTILQIIPDLAAGGAERTTVEMAEAIVQAGGRALVASRGGRLEDALESVGGELVRMNAKSKNPLTIRWNASKLVELIQAEHVDLIHARSRAPAWSARVAAHKTAIPFVTTYHGAYSGSSALKIRYNAVMAAGERVIANSDWIAAHVRDVHEVERERLVTIPRGVDLEMFDPATVSDDRVEAVRRTWGLMERGPVVLLLPGRLTSWKGQMVAIRAMARLTREEQASARLVLAGDPQGRDNYMRTLEDAIIEYGLGGCVVLADHCTDMPAAYLACDIALMPSTRPEAFGRVAAEAAAMGRPVIASDHGGARETVLDGRTGVLVKPGDPVELAGAIRTLRDIRPEARAAMGETGSRHVRERFSKRGLQIATLKVYSELLRETV